MLSWNASQLDLLAPVEACIERHAVDGGQQVDAPWRLPELNHRVGIEVAGAKPE